MPMLEQIDAIFAQAQVEISAVSDSTNLEAARVKYFGRQGQLSQIGESMKTLSKEERPAVGKKLNEVRQTLTAALDERAKTFAAQHDADALAQVDLSLPGTPLVPAGSLASFDATPRPRGADFPPDGVSPSPTARTSRTNGTVSTLSTRPPTTRRATSRTLSICLTAACCARTPPPCRSARWRPSRRPCGSSHRGPCTAATRWTPRTSRSSTNSRDCTSIRA